MSEKRFKLIKPLGTRLGLKDIFIKDTKEDYYYSAKEDVVDLLNELSEEIERLKKNNTGDNQENEVKECQFCGEFRTEYHEYEDYSWSAEDYCNAGHDLEDTDPNSCKDYWDK